MSNLDCSVVHLPFLIDSRVSNTFCGLKYFTAPTKEGLFMHMQLSQMR